MTIYEDMVAACKGKKLTGVERIAIERARQIDVEGYDQAHDFEHDDGSIAMAAACYAACAARRGRDNDGPGRIYVMKRHAASIDFIDPWPWEDRFDGRPHDGNVLKKASQGQAIRMLEKAGALIAAEIDRLTRDGDADSKEEE